MNNNRILYLDVARILAVASMVMLHVPVDWPPPLVPSSEWQAVNVYTSLTRFCVPLFVMISGALFLQPDKAISLKRLYGKNILRLVTAFIFWSIIYAALTTYWPLNVPKTAPASGIKALAAFAHKVASGHAHMWFLYMIVGLYMIVPFLKKITADKKLTEYFLLLAFVFALVVPGLSTIPALAEPLKTAVGEQRMNFYFVMGYSFYFVGGFYLHHYTLSPAKKYGVYLLGGTSLLFTFFMSNYISIRAGRRIDLWYGNLLPQTAMTTLAIFIFLRDNVSKIQFREKTVEHILTASKYSFGIYLVHALFLYVCTAYKIDRVLTPNVHAIITIPLYAVIVFACCYATSAILNRIPILNRYIV